MLAHNINNYSIDPPAGSRACREDASHQKEERERDAAPKPEKCIGKYVCIENDSRAYPGFVEDAGLAQVYANCMHSVGKEMLNCFFFSFLFCQDVS